MRIPKEQLTREKMSWDQWRAFHWGVKQGEISLTGNYSYPPFIVFDTGEVIFTHNRASPDIRGYYRLLGVSVVSSIDEQMPLLTVPDGTPVKKSWYDNGGAQQFVIDWATRRVVRLDDLIPEERDTRPQRVRARGRVYFPGEGLPPVGGPCVVNRPWKQVVTPEQKDHIQTLIDVQAMEVALLDRKMGAWQTRVGVPTLLSVASWKDLSANDQSALFFKQIRAYDPFDYLLLHPDEKEPVT